MYSTNYRRSKLKLYINCEVGIKVLFFLSNLKQFVIGVQYNNVKYMSMAGICSSIYMYIPTHKYIQE